VALDGVPGSGREVGADFYTERFADQKGVFPQGSSSDRYSDQRVREFPVRVGNLSYHSFDNRIPACVEFYLVSGDVLYPVLPDDGIVAGDQCGGCLLQGYRADPEQFPDNFIFRDADHLLGIACAWEIAEYICAAWPVRDYPEPDTEQDLFFESAGVDHSIYPVQPAWRVERDRGLGSWVTVCGDDGIFDFELLVV